MKKLTKTLSTAGLAAALLFSSVSAASASGVHYKDVNKGDNFYKSVEYLLDEKAISRSLPNFRPYENVTRGQVASISAKVWHLENRYNYKPKLEDVPQTHQFYPYIAKIMNYGIMTGYEYGGYHPKTRFGVNDPLTRGQFAGMILNLSKLPLVSDKSYIKYGGKESDIFDGENFKGTWGQHIATLEVLGYMSGFGDGTFRQNKPINRSQFANMLAKTAGTIDSGAYFELFYQFKELGISEEVTIEKLKSLKNNDVVTLDGIYNWFDPSFSSYHGIAVLNIKKEGVILFEDIHVKIIVSRDPNTRRGYNYKVERIEDETAETEESTKTTPSDTAAVVTTDAE